MKKGRLLKTAIPLVIAASIISFSGCSSKTISSGTSTVYGKVTAVDGNKITIAIGTMNQPGGNQKGNTTGGGNAPQGNPPNGQQGNNSGTGSSYGSNMPQGNQPSGQMGGAPDMLTLTGESKTIIISDTCIITKQAMMGGPGGQAPNGQSSTNTSDSSKASLSDITVGSILKITYKKSLDNLVSVEIISSMGGNSTGSAQAGGNTAEVTGTGAYTLSSGTAAKSNETLTASGKDQSAVIVSNGASLTLSNDKIETSGSSSSMDSSSFYGLNAAVLAKAGSKTISLAGGGQLAPAK